MVQNNRRDGRSKEVDRVQQYNRAYYKKHGRKLTDHKNKRYANDPEYNARIRACAKVQRDKKRQVLRGRVVRVYGGKKFLAYKLGRVAKSLNVSAAQIVAWEKMGLLPQSIFKGVRTYTERQVQLIAIARDAVRSRNSISAAKVYVGLRILGEWFAGV